MQLAVVDADHRVAAKALDEDEVQRLLGGPVGGNRRGGTVAGVIGSPCPARAG